jgi:hypothetical protein
MLTRRRCSDAPVSTASASSGPTKRIVYAWRRVGSHDTAPKAVRRHEKAASALSCLFNRPQGDYKFLGNRVLMGVFEWRDPDSNRGHHDFQARFRTGRIRLKCLRTSWFALSAPPANESRNLRPLAVRLGTEIGQSA